MFYDAIERAYTVLEANFETDMLALAEAKSEIDLHTSAEIFKRRPIDLFTEDLEDNPAGIGIYAAGATTGAVRQGKRDSRITIVLEYVGFGQDPDVLAKQVELAAEALMRSVDRFTDGGGVAGAGEEEFGVVVEHGNLSHAEGSNLYEDWLRIRFPVIERDEVS